MINKKLDDILQDISILKDIFNNNEYFKKIEEATERQNKWNNELVEKINNLQSKIDKAIEILGQYKHLSNPTEEQTNEQEEIVSNAYDILKEDK